MPNKYLILLLKNTNYESNFCAKIQMIGRLSLATLQNIK